MLSLSKNTAFNFDVDTAAIADTVANVTCKRTLSSGHFHSLRIFPVNNLTQQFPSAAAVSIIVSSIKGNPSVTSEAESPDVIVQFSLFCMLNSAPGVLRGK